MSSLGVNPARVLYRNAEVEAGTSEFDKIKATRGMMSKSQGDINRKALNVGKPLGPRQQARAEMGVDRPKVVVASHRKVIRQKREAVLEANKKKEEESATNGNV
jgi:hypothetical protein